MPKLAIQEILLPGANADQRLAKARELGFSGVEFAADELDDRVPEIHEALATHGLAAAGVNMGRMDGWLSADMRTRDRATDLLRLALTCALDLEAAYVTLAPQYGATDLPDLTPFASPIEMQKEMLIWLLRGVTDLADAMDAALALQPVNHYETSFITRMAGVAFFRRELDDHPKITIAANTFHMALGEADLLASLKAHHEAISVVYLSDNNGRLPGQGFLPFAAIGEALKSVDYRRWLVLASSIAGSSHPTAAELTESLDYLRRCNLA